MATINAQGQIVTAPTSNTVSPLTITTNNGQISNPPAVAPKPKLSGVIIDAKTGLPRQTNFADQFSTKPSAPATNFSATSPTQIVSSSAPARDRQAEVKTSSQELYNAISGSPVGGDIDPATGMLKTSAYKPPEGGSAPTSSAPAPVKNTSGANQYWKGTDGTFYTVLPGNKPPAGAIQTDIEGNSLTSADTINKSNSTVQDWESSPQYAENKATIDAANRALGIFTPEEQAQIEQEGIAAGAAYDTSIIDAKRSKYYGMPEAVQAGLRVGGAMNTQIAGASAAPGQEGLNVGSVIGRGGELEKISSAYDFNIASLESAKNAAIQTAKVSAQRAMQTGKKQDKQAAIDAYDKAQQAWYQQQELIDRRKSTLTALSQYEEKQAVEKKESSWTQTKDLLNTFGSAALDDMDEAVIKELETNAGLPKGTLQKGIKTLKEIEAAGKELNLREVDGSLYNVYTDENGQVQSELVVRGTAKGSGGGGSGSGANLSAGQQQRLLQITNKYQADPIVLAASKATMAESVANAAIADPKKAGSQLSLLYSLVKNLDPDSAVREGELALAQQTQSYFDRFKNSLDRISQGKLLSEKATIELANETKALAKNWYAMAQRREKGYQAQASVIGLGENFQEYRSMSGNIYGTDEEEPVGSKQVEYQGKIYNVDENGDMTLA